ncbi:MAG: class I SAM-dependent methyltransferase [Planctomycetes bacterium]|nr:class I SAM-dependent methyltransferase [Planctomycetota bacterium]
MANEIYQTADEARQATDVFYADQGFEYTPEQVNQWLNIYLPRGLGSVAVLDLCCGDGIWSKGIKSYSDNAQMYGIDISAGAIEKANNVKLEEYRFVRNTHILETRMETAND